VIDIGCLDFFIIPSAPHPINRSGLAVYQIHIADFLRQIQEVSSSLILAVILPAGPVTGGPRQTQNAVVLLGARWQGDLGVLYPICTQFISVL